MWSLRPDFLGVNPTWLSPNCVTPGKILNLSVPLCPLLQNGEDDYNSSNWNCCEDEMGNIYSMCLFGKHCDMIKMYKKNEY